MVLVVGVWVVLGWWLVYELYYENEYQYNLKKNYPSFLLYINNNVKWNIMNLLKDLSIDK
jgi:hypothetical protein